MADPRISEDFVLSHSELINQVEDQREVYNTALKDAWADFREELKTLGLTGKEIAKEVADLKGAISDERMTQEERAKADDKEEGRASYRAILTGSRARARIREAKTASQPSPKAGQAVTAREPVVTPSVENEAAEISTPIQPEAATSFADAAAHSVEANDHDSNAVASVPATQDGNANIGGQNEDRSRTRSVTLYRRPGSEPAPNVGQADDEHQRIGPSETNEAPAGRVADESPALNTYAAPGIVVMETTPPEGVTAHPYAACWPVRDIDVSEGVREPIVKIGKLILDGRGRMFAARGWNGGKGMAYPVVQYDGTDPLMDCIRWNLASRPNLHPHNLKIIAQKLVKEAPDRADEIHAAMGVVDEVAA